jgi:adenosylcobinamide-phosphate synthase
MNLFPPAPGLAVAAGLLADRGLGEPDERWHPVVAFGKTMRLVERRLYGDDPWRGAVHTAAGVGLGVGGATVLARLCPRPGRRFASTLIATFTTVAGRALGEAAAAVAAALAADDLVEARRLLPTLVGRDPAELDGTEVARAVIESVAENTVDAVVAPALWAAFAGPAGTLAYRAVNTMDAMVGHHSARYERYGRASARLDDVANWVPARVCAGLVALRRPDRAVAVWHAVRRDAPGHPSPNAGVAEAAFAAALGLRLGGVNRYGERIEVRGPLGCGRRPEAADVARAVDLSREVTLLLAGLLALRAVLAGLARPSSAALPWR